MKCQNCGNELGQNEVFCGQCGTPNTTPAQPTELIPQAPSPAPRSGLLGGAYRNSGFSPTQPGQAFPSENMPSSSQSAIRQGPQPSGGFYQDATEAISSIPGMSANYPPGAYPQQGFPGGGSMPGGYNNVGQFGAQQPFAAGNPTFPPTQMGFPGSQLDQRAYGPGSGAGLPIQPQQKRSNVVMIIGIVCLAFAIIVVGTFGTLFALRSSGNTTQPVAQVTATVLPTTAPTPTPSPTPAPTPSPTPTPSLSPTPTPDTGYSWCGAPCTGNGYQVESPNSNWLGGPTADGNGFVFTDQLDTNIYVAFKTPSGATSATDLINADISGFSNLATPTSGQPLTGSVSIGGENWDYQIISYTGSANQIEQVNVYATIHGGKGYIIELAAPQSPPTNYPNDGFSSVQSTYFNTMLASFQFVTPTQQ
jgi:hypothetical protein